MIREGTLVSWAWGNGRAQGKVCEIFRHEVTRTLQGAEVTRNGSDNNPAYLIEQDDGDHVLKLQSEVRSES
jgi:hypothetical protein